MKEFYTIFSYSRTKLMIRQVDFIWG